MSAFELDSPATMTIDGEAVDGHGGIRRDQPSTGAPFAQMPAATSGQIDAAFAAADRAFTDWERG